MNELRTVAGTLSLALKTVRIANMIKKAAVAVSIAVCAYVIYRSLRRR